MDVQQVWHLSFLSAWISVFIFPSVFSGLETQKLSLESTVFVAFADDVLNITYELKIPANQSQDNLTCSDPFNKQIYNCVVNPLAGQPLHLKKRLELKKLNRSGEYSCRYKTAKVYWFLRVRGDGYKDLAVTDYTECIILAICIGILLVFSVVGSVYVFRGNLKECGRKQRKNKEVRKMKETEKEDTDVTTAPAASFYASLEPRPRSIYDVLDCPAANTGPDQGKAKHKKEEPQNKITQSTQPQHEGVFESVYENF